jgi:aspartate/methionine/tyrosine aminotransferase
VGWFKAVSMQIGLNNLEIITMTIAQKIQEAVEQSSWIRKMFEEGARLKARFGSENVYDFSIGNPNLPPPAKFNEVLRDTVDSCGLEDHCYMPQSGYPQVCKSIADYLSEEQEVPLSENEVAMTCGAAGALNVILKTLLDPGMKSFSPFRYSWITGLMWIITAAYPVWSPVMQISRWIWMPLQRPSPPIPKR